MFGVLCTGIDLPCCDMVLMSSTMSQTANEQRAARALRLYPGKQSAVVAVFGAAEDMTGLQDLVFAANETKAVTTCIEATSSSAEATVAAQFSARMMQQRTVDAEGVEWRYEEWLQLCKDYMAETGIAEIAQGIEYNGKRIGLWVNRQRSAYRRGTLDKHRMDQCRATGIRLEKTMMNTDETYEFLKYCVDNNIKSSQKTSTVIQYQGLLVNPGVKLTNLRGRWNELTDEMRSKYGKIGIKPSRSHAQIWTDAFEAWKVAKQKGVVSNGTKEYNWQGDQRRFKKKNAMSAERVALLEEAGFEWTGDYQRN